MLLFPVVYTAKDQLPIPILLFPVQFPLPIVKVPIPILLEPEETPKLW